MKRQYIYPNTQIVALEIVAAILQVSSNADTIELNNNKGKVAPQW